MNELTYLDTSALAKWYLNEPRSEAFRDFVVALERADVSRLTVVEFRCLLARRRRNREIDARIERKVVAAFEDHVAQGYLEVHPLEDRHALAARDLLVTLGAHPLRTLDALHLAIAETIGAKVFATADGVLARAARARKLRVVRFG